MGSTPNGNLIYLCLSGTRESSWIGGLLILFQIVIARTYINECKCLMPASLERMSLRVDPVCTGLISTLFTWLGPGKTSPFHKPLAPEQSCCILLMCCLHPTVQLSVVSVTCLVPIWVAFVVPMPVSWVGLVGVVALFYPELEFALNTSNSCKNITEFTVISLHNWSASSFDNFYTCTGPELI